jgi:hypothetical protein
MGSNAVSSTGINTGSIVRSMADLAIETTSVVSSSTVETSSTVVDAETQEEDGFLWVPVPTKNKGRNKDKGKATESVAEKVMKSLTKRYQQTLTRVRNLSQKTMEQSIAREGGQPQSFSTRRMRISA